MAKGEGSSRLLIFILLGLLGAGGYNYHRNFQAEAAVPRPYESYGASDLEALLSAYEGETAALEQRYEQVRRAKASQRTGMLDENVRAFEAAQRRSATSRGLGEKLSMQQAAARDIRAELDLREAHADVLRMHLKRLVTL